MRQRQQLSINAVFVFLACAWLLLLVLLAGLNFKLEHTMATLAIEYGSVGLLGLTGLALARSRFQRHVADRKHREEAATLFNQQLITLHEVTNELSQMQTLDDLCRQAVELGRSRLGFSRLGIWLLEEGPSGLSCRGAYGTSETGQTTDERSICYTGGDIEKWATCQGERLNYASGRTLLNGHRDKVGSGAKATATLWKGSKIQGSISADDLLHPGSLTKQQAEILALYAAALGHLISRKRTEDMFRQFNQQLRILHEVSNELSRAQTFDELCRRAVELGRSRLGFSRMGIWFLQELKEHHTAPIAVKGAFGTSVTGETTDERSLFHDTDETFAALIRERKTLYYAKGPLLGSNKEQVGVGTKAMAFLWDGATVTGAISADDLLAPGSLTKEQAEILVLYAATIGHLCSLKNADTKREQLEEQLRHAQKMEAVGQLAGGVAHDFNNILQVILGHVDMVLSDLRDAEIRQPLEEVFQAAGRAADLTHQLLAFSRRQVIRPANLDLNKLVEGTLKMIDSLIGEHISLCFMPARCLGTIYADPGQIEQILINLCVNARDAMPNGGTLTIETNNVTIGPDYLNMHPWATEVRYVQFTVTDTGHGIDEATRAQIFEPFFTTKSVGRGTGLGLATVYGIVEQHNGHIQVYSELGKGTAFKIYIPIVESPAEEIHERIIEPVVGGTETILVAEDEELVRNLVTNMLRSAGYTVLTASDGEEAIRKYDQHADSIALALLDVVMPKLGGREVMDHIQARTSTIPFLFSSGYSENAVHTNFVIEEGLHLISKPYGKNELLRAVRKILDERQA